MPYNKVNLDKKITSKKARQNAFYKRKMGIMRKVIQLSKLCEKKVVLYIYDDELAHLFEYKNDDAFDLKTVL